MDKIQKIKGIIQPNDLSILETTGSSNNIVGRDDKGNFTYKVSDYDISYNFKQETDFFIDRFGLDSTNVGGITNWSFLGTVVGSGSNATHPQQTGNTTITIQTSSFTTTINTSTLTTTPQNNFNIATGSMAWTSSLLSQFNPGTQLSASIRANQIYSIDIPYNSLVDDGINQNTSFNNIEAGAYRTPNWRGLYTTTTSSNSTRDRFFLTSSTLPKSRTLSAFTQIVAGPRIRLFISASAAEITSSIVTSQTINFNYERNNDYWGVTNYSPIHQPGTQQDSLQRGIWTFAGTPRNVRRGDAGPIYLPTSSNDPTYYTAVGSRTAFSPKFNTTYEMEALLYLPPPKTNGTVTGYNATASNEYRWGFFFGLANKEVFGGSGWSPLYTNSSSTVDVTQFPNFVFPLSENQFLANTSSFNTNFRFDNSNNGTGKIVGRGIGQNNLLGFLYGGMTNNVTSSFSLSTPSEEVWGLKALSKGYNLGAGILTASPTLMTSSIVPLTSSVCYPFVGGKTYSLKLKYTIGAFVSGSPVNQIPFTVDWFVNGIPVYSVLTNLTNTNKFPNESDYLNNTSNTLFTNNSIPNLFTSYINLTPCFYMTTLSGSNNYRTFATTNSFRPAVTIDYIKTRIYSSDASDRSGDVISLFT